MNLSSSTRLAARPGGHLAAAFADLHDGRGDAPQLSVEFQPIVDLQSGTIFAHEALLRGPSDSAYRTPRQVLDRAQREGQRVDVELLAVSLALQAWSRCREPGRLFVNISAFTLMRCGEGAQVSGLVDQIRASSVLPRQLVLEITEDERVADLQALQRAVAPLSAAGVSLALDDFADGYSSLRLWSELRPSYVKLGNHFTRSLRASADKTQMLQALGRIAELFDARLIAEGIEAPEDLRAIRDLKVALGQGYLLGRPGPGVAHEVSEDGQRVLRDRRVSVLPQPQRAVGNLTRRRLVVIHAPVARPDTSNDEIAGWFLQSDGLHAIAVAEGDRPLALINREQFLNHYATLYFKELYGRKPCLQLANREPKLIELDYDIDELLSILTSQDQRYLKDGFIVTENGRYVGLGTGDQLVRIVTEARIEAARHANPLTFLPGNVPLTEHIGRLLDRQGQFAACYLDLNDFKPFNDTYGYLRGDEMIRLVAQLCLEHSDTQLDFVGHVGGDDFVILFQSSDWQRRCAEIQADFARRAPAHYDEDSRRAGGIRAPDRYGVARFFPFTSLVVGAVPVLPGRFASAAQVASAVAAAKHEAKMRRR
ncbi:MAG: GGDEF domain-containing protein [Paucibacter sp.]|nr:GGDEF domain-containing protein [Roseateles sp.]